MFIPQLSSTETAHLFQSQLFFNPNCSSASVSTVFQPKLLNCFSLNCSSTEKAHLFQSQLFCKRNCSSVSVSTVSTETAHLFQPKLFIDPLVAVSVFFRHQVCFQFEPRSPSGQNSCLHCTLHETPVVSTSRQNVKLSL